MPKPFLYGPLIRAGVFGFIALFALKGPFVVMSDEARYPHPGLPANYMTYVWASALFVFAVCAVLAFRVATEAFPPSGTLYFPVKKNITFLDALISPVGFFFLLLAGLFPRMWINPMGGFGPRPMDVQQLVIMPAMALVLMLWRPMWSVTRGKPLTRFPVGPWLPWKQEFPVQAKLEWVDFWAGKPRMHVGWQLTAFIGELTIDLEVVDLNTPQPTLDAIRAEWAQKFDTGVVADAATQQAALNRKKVKPWHMLAAIFGLPGFALLATSLFSTDLRGGEAGVMVSLLAGTGALSLWFLSRFVATKGLTVWIAVFALVGLSGVLTGLARGKRSALNHALKYVCEGRGLAGAEPGEGLRWFTHTGYAFEPTERDAPSNQPKYVVCQRYSTNTVERRDRAQRTRTNLEVTVRTVATAEVVLTQTLEGEAPAPFDDASPRSIDGKAPVRAVVEAALLSSIP